MSRNSPKHSINKKDLNAAVLSFFHSHPHGKFNYKQIGGQLNITDHSQRLLLNAILDDLSGKGILMQKERGKFSLKQKTSFIVGVVESIASGAAFVVSEESEKDIYISSSNTKNAFSGDTVKVRLLNTRKGGKPEGEITEIINRAKTEFVGRLDITTNFAFLVPDNNKAGFDIFVPLSKIKDAKHHDKVVVRVLDWGGKDNSPNGEVIRVLGQQGDNTAEMHAILEEFGLPYEFPPEVERDASSTPIEITEAEIKNRRDFRKVTTFTIDPVDAKDFDDALSIQKLENNNWEIGIHIADVSHYVKEGTILDDEAYNRATSVYLVDRVVPMLPEILSNNVCSLRPNEEKLCFSAVFEISENAEVLSQWFGRTIINSDRRFSYEEAQEIIETKAGDFSNEMLTLNNIAVKLREERFRKGSIGFEKNEVKFKLDEKGMPLGVYFKVAKDSNKLIEEFMLLANRRVATFVAHFGQTDKNLDKDKNPFVYRIHDSPDKDRLDSFSKFAGRFGYKINTGSNNEISSSINKFIKEVSGKKEANMLEQIAIRTMAKAVYSTDNIGHYGLAFDFYTHFTSPIRRYPDVLVHRLLQHYLDVQSGESKMYHPNVKELEEQCMYSSAQEKKAADAERSSIKFKQVQFLQDKIGMEFPGVITGVTEWGIFVELEENLCEGMIRYRDMPGDYYDYDEKNYCVYARSSKEVYRLGDRLKIQIKRADLSKKQIDFSLVEKMPDKE